MSIIGSDGLSLSVGDGTTTETFNVLKGAMITKLEITQRTANSNVVGTNAWQVGVAVAARRATLSCEGLMTNDLAPQRLRSIAISGWPANFHLALDTSETLVLSAYVTSYQEVIQAGAIKRFTCQIESTGAVSGV